MIESMETAIEEAKKGDLKLLQTIITNAIVEDMKKGDFELLNLIAAEVNLDMLEIIGALKRKHSP